ncbi:MAG: hypothetical protein M3Q03_08335 [Chloroflexota bacterium]|nr:hypothetical protein [Chloroflexota bacterium]
MAMKGPSAVASEPSVGGTDVQGADGLSRVTNQVQEATEQVQEQAGQLVDQVRQQVVTQLTAQKERAAGGLETAALLIRQAGEQVRQQGQAPIAGYIEGAADRVAEFSDTLRDRDVPQLLEETQDLARRRPGLFLGGSLALGFLATRFFKSSAQPSLSQETRTDYLPATGEDVGYGGGTVPTFPEAADYGVSEPTSGSLSEAMTEARLGREPTLLSDYSSGLEDR